MANSNKEILNKILKTAEKERFDLHHPYVGSEHLLLSLIKNKNNLTLFLDKYDLNYNKFKKELVEVVGTCTKNNDVNLYTPLLRKIIKRYEKKLKDNIENDIFEDLFLCLLDEGEGIAIRIMLKMNVDLDEAYFTLKEKRKLLEMETSNKIGILLNNHVDMDEKVIDREEEINKIIVTLTRRKKCNPLLIGPAGVGKTAIVEELTRRIIKGNVPNSLKGYKVFMMEMGSLVSGTKYRGEFEERLNKIIKEIINDKKTIIFIDEIHTMVNAGGAEGAINASDILKPYLARGEIKCIGATTINEFNDSVLKDKALTRRFDIISVKEPTKVQMQNILSKIKCEYEKYHEIKITNKMVKRIIDLSDYYLHNISNPDKSIDLLDSSCACAKINGNKKELTEKDILNTIFYKTSNNIINNTEVVNKLKKDLKPLMDSKYLSKLCDSFMFKPNVPISIILDDSKIEEAIRKNLNDINTITLDLSSFTYHNQNSIINEKSINDTIFCSLIDKPYSLILFKNINKTNPCILDEITKINKDGYINLKPNEKLYFNNAIIIASYSKEYDKQTGFTKSSSYSKLPINFTNSFQCDLRESIKKEITSC